VNDEQARFLRERWPGGRFGCIADSRPDRGVRAESDNEIKKPHTLSFPKMVRSVSSVALTLLFTWLNLLNNDSFQAWVTHRGNFKCLMPDRGLNGLTNPQERLGYLYVRDTQTGKFFLLNRPAPGSSWECRQRLGFTAICTAALGLRVTAVYCVPR
jgi:hypothetical protein